MCERECHIMMSLSHPNIVRLQEVKENERLRGRPATQPSGSTPAAHQPPPPLSPSDKLKLAATLVLLARAWTRARGRGLRL